MPLSSRFHWVMHTLLGFKVPTVQQSAVAAGGFCTWPFSQVRDPVKSLICSHTDTSGGICEMLAAKWLESHANNGSIVNWIMDSSGTQVDPNKIRQLMQWFAVGVSMRAVAMNERSNEGGMDQSLATERWLRTHGVVRRRRITGGVPLMGGGHFHHPRVLNGQRGRQSRSDFSADIAHGITSSSGSYKMIGIEGSNFAHAMAAWSDQDVSFFDPNFGEFWFARPEDFHAWFPRFWQLAGYAAPMVGLSESYTIDEYAPTA
ncbi:YopT-type cysteine protease domain-containing protein [Hahella ganghwensis]|uniref:YopT-type cysteine protease domain-containing protein n=1 Tax=Hahella ganghwensis TaxID=286420 RepID=UPI0003A05102|nr:YopT-type cysteine protease domain-containing protein [Hahella ganghwensis]